MPASPRNANFIFRTLQIDPALLEAEIARQKKELEIEGHAPGSGPVPLDPGPLDREVEERKVEVEQVGDKVLKLSFTRFVGRRKTTMEIEVRRGELDDLVKEKEGAAQLLLF